MDNQVTIFNNPEFGEIRTAGTADNPMFCLADVCKALSLNASHVRERLDDGVVSTDTILDSLGRKQVANFVTEWTQRGRLFLYDALKEVGILPQIERTA